MIYEKQLLINDTYLSTDKLADNFTNFVDPDVTRLVGSRREKKVTEIILHETVTVNTGITIGVLKKRNLGVHFIVGPHGDITQHGDPVLDQLAHAGWPHNGLSVGIEIVNPYYPAYNSDGPWDTVLDARWAHKKKYVVPLPDQLEATYQLVTRLLEINTPEFHVKDKWVGLDAKRKRLAMARVTGAKYPMGGVMAHAAFGHADGSFPLLYCILRKEAEMNQVTAHAIAQCLANTDKWWADLSRVL